MALDFGPIKTLIESEDVTEVMVNAWNKVYVEHKGLLVETSAKFVDPRQFEEMIFAILSDDQKIQDKAQFNLGNAYYKFGAGKEQLNLQDAINDLEKSMTHYEKVLGRPQKDSDAQSNYEFVKKELERLKQKQQEQKDQKQDQKQQNQQDEQKQQNKDSKDSKDNKDSSGQDKKDQKPSDRKSVV